MSKLGSKWISDFTRRTAHCEWKYCDT